MTDTTILQNNTHVIKPKKSVALSGVPAGNTALCTVGKSGNDLHYRGYDILDLAEHCEFEEVAHLLIHGKLPTRDELNAYKSKLKALRGLPANVRTVLEALPAASHPMDVMRTGVSALGCTLPEKEDIPSPARAILPISCWPRSALSFFTGITTATTANVFSRKPTMIPSAAISCICCMVKSQPKAGKRRCIFRWCCMPSMSSTLRRLPAG